MLKIKKIDHIAVAVPNIDQYLPYWQQIFGSALRDREIVHSQTAEIALLSLGDNDIELVQPSGYGPLTKFLEKRGPGLHHIAVEVEDIDQALDFLRSTHVPLVDDTPRIGARGHKVAFLHPKATGGVLIELIERIGKEQVNVEGIPNDSA